ncbi:MAG: cache domain-containing protein [Anaerolineae bacterium]|nr:cache domain-containing protein [Anaerolineae bacterium]
MLLAILGAAIIPAAVVTLLILFSFQQSRTLELVDERGILTIAEAEVMSELIVRQVEIGRLFANIEAIKRPVEASNEFFEAFDGNVIEEINRRNAQWIAAVSNDTSIPLMDTVLNVDSNAASIQSAELIERFPLFEEVLITDSNGVLVAASDVTSDYYQADEDWWQGAWNAGVGEIWIAETIDFDESTGRNVLQIALPIEQGGVVSGVLRLDINEDILLERLQSFEIGATGRLLILDKQGDIIVAGRESERNFDLPPSIQRLHLVATFELIDIEGVSTVVGVAHSDRQRSLCLRWTICNGRWFSCKMKPKPWYQLLMHVMLSSCQPCCCLLLLCWSVSFWRRR